MTSIWFLQKGGSPEESKFMDGWIFCGSISPLYLDQYVGSIPSTLRCMNPAEKRCLGNIIQHRGGKASTCFIGSGNLLSVCASLLWTAQLIFLVMILDFLGFFFSLDSYICLFCSSFLLKKQNDFNKIKTLSPSSKKQNKTKLKNQT